MLVVVGALLARPGRVEALPVDHGEDEDVDAVHQPQHGQVVALVPLPEMPGWIQGNGVLVPNVGIPTFVQPLSYV